MAILSRPRNQRPPRLDLRITILSILIVASFAAIAGRLYYLQILKSAAMAELADRNRIRVLKVPATRGVIFDRRHRPLVDSHPTFDAVLVPEDTPDLAATIEKLDQYLGGDHIAETLKDADNDDRPQFQPITAKAKLSWEQVVALEAHQLELPGVSLQVTPRRHYLYGTMAAHLLGYVGEVSPAEMTQLADYHMGDEIGKFGLERGLEGFLRGANGGQQIEVDSVGRRLRLLGETPERPGESVVLTLDLDVQQAAEKAMEGKNGALVALDPNSGEIFAMVSHPAFDPDVFAGGIDSADWKKLNSDPTHPLQNRVIQGAYPPGSTFKLVDTIAGLQEKTLTLDTAYHCAGGMWFGGREYRCWRKQGHGGISLHRAIVESCDVFFYNVGNKLGIDRIAKWANSLGLGSKSGIQLDNERQGIVPSSAWKQRRFHERWYPAETLSVAIGQGYVTLTPIALAELAEQIANGGIRYRPRYAKMIEGLDGRPVRVFEPVIEGRADLDPETLAIVRDAMADVVNGPGGTAHKAKLDGITVCGKTGTAQVVKEEQGARIATNKMAEELRDHAWFIAYAPKENPQIAIAVIVEHGGHGGSAAAPLVHDVLQKYFELYPPTGAAPQVVSAPPHNSSAEPEDLSN